MRRKRSVQAGKCYHIHVLIFLEDGREMSVDEILSRVNALYR